MSLFNLPTPRCIIEYDTHYSEIVSLCKMDMGKVNKAKSGLKMLDVPMILLIFSAQNTAQTSLYIIILYNSK